MSGSSARGKEHRGRPHRGTSFFAATAEPTKKKIYRRELVAWQESKPVLLAEVDALQMINDILMIFNISRCSSFTKSAGQNNKLLYCIIRLVRPLSVCLSVFCHVTLYIL